VVQLQLSSVELQLEGLENITGMELHKPRDMSPVSHPQYKRFVAVLLAPHCKLSWITLGHPSVKNTATFTTFWPAGITIPLI
jgi:hypothetical protein